MAHVACFGEILLRLSPPGSLTMAQTRTLEMWTGGAEANVAAVLAGLGHEVRMVSALPDNGPARSALAALRGAGVDTTHVATAEGRIGTYYYTAGRGLRAGLVEYDRAGSAFAVRPAASWDFGTALGGAGHLHLSGITPALGEDTARASLAVIEAARRAGATISFDCNYRPALWRVAQQDPLTVLPDLIARVDYLFGNHRDAALLLGRDFAGEGSVRRRDAAEALLGRFDNLQAIASTARHVESGTHRLEGGIDRRDHAAESEEWVLTDIVDRIGTGDAFAAGVLHGWLDPAVDDAAALDMGMRALCLKHFLAGDHATMTAPDLAKLERVGGDVAR